MSAARRRGAGGACRLMARACAAALCLDSCVPRPGLTSLLRPAAGHEPLGFLGLTGLGYEACLCACRLGLRRSRGWTRCWLRAVEEMLAAWGNTGLGSLWLLSLQAAGFGRAAALGLEWRDWAVMGAALEAVELEGVEGAARLYRGLSMAAPRYLGRISWAGLPDASSPWSSMEAWERGVGLAELVREAGLYDLVMRDSAEGLGLSLGYVLGALEEWAAEAGLVEAFRRATLLAASLGDMLVRRRSGVPRETFREAMGSPVAEARLWGMLRRGGGPGGAADLAASAAARLLAKWLAGLVELRSYPGRG